MAQAATPRDRRQAAAVLISSPAKFGGDVCARRHTDDTPRGSHVPSEADVERMVNRFNYTESIWIEQRYPDLSRNGHGTTKYNVMESIETMFSELRHVYFIYYSGHAQNVTGNWCFESGRRISLDAILSAWDERVKPRMISKTVSKGFLRGSKTVRVPVFTQTLVIISDSPFSGAWVDELKRRNIDDVVMQASCGAQEICTATKDGGFFTTRWAPNCLEQVKMSPLIFTGLLGFAAGFPIGVVAVTGSAIGSVVSPHTFTPTCFGKSDSIIHFCEVSGDWTYSVRCTSSFYGITMIDCVTKGAEIGSLGRLS